MLSPRVESAALSGMNHEGGGARGMSLNEEKVAELSEARAQHEAVMKIVKDELASKLNSFYILYHAVLLVVSAARFLFLPGGDGWDYLVFFFIANGIAVRPRSHLPLTKTTARRNGDKVTHSGRGHGRSNASVTRNWLP